MEISNEERARRIVENLGVDVFQNGTGKIYYKEDAMQSALEAMKQKDEQHSKENQELRHQIRLLIDAIDHAYLQLDGTYGSLAYEVSDQVKYVKSMQTKELERRMKS